MFLIHTFTLSVCQVGKRTVCYVTTGSVSSVNQDGSVRIAWMEYRGSVEGLFSPVFTVVATSYITVVGLQLVRVDAVHSLS